MTNAEPVYKVSIIPRGMALGLTVNYRSMISIIIQNLIYSIKYALCWLVELRKSINSMKYLQVLKMILKELQR
jgi:ATP-dependent Zn protease